LESGRLIPSLHTHDAGRHVHTSGDHPKTAGFGIAYRDTARGGRSPSCRSPILDAAF
jgi:hypothetical protein